MHVNGRPLKCPHCGGEAFQHKRIMLNTPGMTFFELDWLNKSADTLTCTDCGRIEWFADAVVNGGGGKRDCPRCGFYISKSVSVCPNCGEPA